MSFQRVFIYLTRDIPVLLAKYLIDVGAFNSSVFSWPWVKRIVKAFENSILSGNDEGAFDEAYYLEQNSDVESDRFGALEHYVKYGYSEGRNPCALFDTKFYKEQWNLSVHFPLSELSHFLIYGRDRDVSPSPWFDYRYYKRLNRDVAQSKLNPYLHYLRFGQKENRRASPNFDPDAYLADHPVVKRSTIPAIQHFLDSLGIHRTFGQRSFSRRYHRKHGLNSEDLIEDIEKALEELPERGARENPELRVVIPVFKGRDTTLHCIHSVLTANCQTVFELIVIDDKSPDPELSTVLKRLAQRGFFQLIVHQENLGFVKSVNEGMRSGAPMDVILLNSDTEVYHDWIDRLKAAAYNSHNVSTVTPLTNNGTICSYPAFNQDNPHALEISYRELDQLAAKSNDAVSVPVPTAVGFCMYIRRAAINDVGVFDEEAFGKGYGEENDFCLRAQKKGWTDIVATNVFVRHRGRVSFQLLSPARIENALAVISKRYPSYHRDVQLFCQDDPLHNARANIDAARLAKLAAKNNVLVICHQRGGGTEQHVQEEVHRAEQLGKGVFRLYAHKGHGNIVQLTHVGAPDVPNLADLDIEKDSDRLVYLLEKLKISEVHVHHLVDLSSEAPILMRDLLKRTGIPYSYSTHDYFSICPRINLVDERGVYCGEPDHRGCLKCLEKRGSKFNVTDINLWRSRYRLFLNDASAVITPNDDVSKRLRGYFPHANIVTTPHDEVTPAPLKMRLRDQGAPLRIGVLGAISLIKGFDVLLRCARHVRKKNIAVEFVVVGYTKHDVLARKHGIEITGPYTNDHILELIASSKLDCIFLPSLWPETFSYTLSFALKTGLPIAAFNIGAISERLRDVEHAHLIPFDDVESPMRVVKQLRGLVDRCRVLASQDSESHSRMLS